MKNDKSRIVYRILFRPIDVSVGNYSLVVDEQKFSEAPFGEYDDSVAEAASAVLEGAEEDAEVKRLELKHLRRLIRELKSIGGRSLE